MTREQWALVFSMERLASVTGELYQWLFTFKDVHCLWHYPQIWHRFQFDLEHHVPVGCLGIRVLELHPGGHGVHYHCAFSDRIDARSVWRVARKHGMNWISGKRWHGPPETLGLYLAKYLGKGFKRRLPVQIRRWGGIFGMPCCRVGDVRTDEVWSIPLRYALKFWGHGRGGAFPNVIRDFIQSPHNTGDWRSLICMVDYREFGRTESFHWPDSRFEEIIGAGLPPWFNWVQDRWVSVKNPGLMPDFYEEIVCRFYARDVEREEERELLRSNSHVVYETE